MINQNGICDVNFKVFVYIFARKLIQSKNLFLNRLQKKALSKPFGNFVTASRFGNFVTSSYNTGIAAYKNTRLKQMVHKSA